MASGSRVWPETCHVCGGDVESWWFSDHYSGGSGINCTRPECRWVYTPESFQAVLEPLGLSFYEPAE